LKKKTIRKKKPGSTQVNHEIMITQYKIN